MFPDGSFNPDPRWDRFWREIYEYRLRVAQEASLWAGAPGGERYQFLASDQFPGLIRIEVRSDLAEITAKRMTMEVTGDRDSAEWSVRRFRRLLVRRDLDALRGLIDRADFWQLGPSQHPSTTDGYHTLFEARVGERYHVVDRWCSERGEFTQLGDFCESLFHDIADESRGGERQ